MARKRITDNDLIVSSGAAPAVRRQPPAPRQKHSAPPAGQPQAASIDQPTHEQIAALAYTYWVARGCQGGSPEEDWLRAEQELLSLATA